MYCKKLLLTKCIDLRQESLILLMFTVLLSFFKIKKINKIFLNTFLNIWNNLIKKNCFTTQAENIKLDLSNPGVLKPFLTLKPFSSKYYLVGSYTRNVRFFCRNHSEDLFWSSLRLDLF